MKMKNLIVFEGLDGVGKTTLAHALAEKLRESSITCEYVTFHDEKERTLGRIIPELYKNPDDFGLEGASPASIQALHVASHLDVIERRILPALEEGQWVVLDRSWWSAWAYGNVDEVDEELLEAIIGVEILKWGHINPLVVFVLERKANVIDSQSGIELQKAYAELIARERGKYPVVVINNDGSVDEAIGKLLDVISSNL